ncbi:hypothetical protein BJX66DRAFT_317834 [Aspergillus keveii]|uniref:Uncharacterized protein n=1 Tax=Aspergillus keveii TaxID=714993 RepID=A0ABR4FKL6_9EURO
MSKPSIIPPTQFRRHTGSQAPSSQNESGSANPVTTGSLSGTWYVRLSSSPFWIDKYGVSITFSLDDDDDDNAAAVQSTTPDLETHAVYTSNLSYRTSISPSGDTKAVSGTDRRLGAAPSAENGGTIPMEWRGSGWMKLVKTRWEILGFGGGGPGTDTEWLVAYAEKSMFNPPGISVYSRKRELRAEVEAEIRQVLARMVGEAEEQRDELERLVREVRVVGL